MTLLATCFYIIFFLRLISIFISARTEKRLKQLGATEFGSKNSKFLVLAHFAFYAAALTEGYRKGAFFHDNITVAGTVLYCFAIAVLYYVIYALRHIWTVKLIIAPSHVHFINRGWLFRYIKHPNYYLNIIPELIAVTLIFHAWYTLIIGLPVYLIPLIIRIRQEEQVMGHRFQQYRN